jgi:hypothetical protein
MTNDHWIQVAIGITNAIAVLVAAILTPVIASRINQPKPKLDTAKPKNKILLMRMLKSPWFALGTLFFINIVGLYLDTRSTPLTLRVVFSVSMHISIICFTVVMMFILKFVEAFEMLVDVIKDIAVEIEKPSPPQT